MQFIDALDYKPDNFLVAPLEDWRILSVGHSKRGGTQPRFCAAACEYYIKDKDKKCGRFFECEYYVFDMHRIEKDEMMVLVLFATETTPPYDGLSWWLSEKQFVKAMGRRPNGTTDLEYGQRIVDAMIAEYNALTSPPPEGISINRRTNNDT